MMTAKPHPFENRLVMDTGLREDLRTLEEFTGVKRPPPPRNPRRIARDPLPTGSPMLDFMLAGGWPSGAIIELRGAPGTGKTALALAGTRSAQRRDRTSGASEPVAGIIDAEHGITGNTAEDAGCDPQKLLIARPATLTIGLGMLSGLAPALDWIVVDTLDGLGDLPNDAGIRPESNEDRKQRRKVIAQALARLDPMHMRATVLILTQGTEHGGNAGIGGGVGLARHARIRLTLTPTTIEGRVTCELTKSATRTRAQKVPLQLRAGRPDVPWETVQLAHVLGAVPEHQDLTELVQRLRSDEASTTRLRRECDERARARQFGQFGPA